MCPRAGRRRLELRAEELRRRLDPSRLHFRSTADVPPLVGTIGQPRALDAIEYGLETATHGFNIFVAGAPGSGRLTTILDYLAHARAREPCPPTGSTSTTSQSLTGRARSACRRAAAPSSPTRWTSSSTRRGARSRGRSRATSTSHRQREIARRRTRARGPRGGARGVRARSRVSPARHADGARVDAAGRRRADHARALRPDPTRPARRDRSAQGRRSRSAPPATCATSTRSRRKWLRRIQELEREVAQFATGPLFRELEERFAASRRCSSTSPPCSRSCPSDLQDFREREQTLPALRARGRAPRPPCACA